MGKLIIAQMELIEKAKWILTLFFFFATAFSFPVIILGFFTL